MQYYENENIPKIEEIENLLDLTIQEELKPWKTLNDSELFKSNESDNLEEELNYDSLEDLFNNPSDLKIDSDTFKENVSSAKKITSNRSGSKKISKEQQEKFISENYNFAKELSQKYNIPINLILGAGAQESAWGTTPQYLKYNIVFNMKASSKTSKSIKLGDIDMHKNRYVDNYKTYNSRYESMEDFAKWCVRHNISGNDNSELAKSFGWSKYAEGVGSTYTEAKNNLTKSYNKILNQVDTLMKDLKLV